MTKKSYRDEHDSMGTLKVPIEALWGAQTQRAVNNFPITGLVMPRAFIGALGLIKWAAAGVNSELGLIATKKGRAIQAAALEVAEGLHDNQFPIDVFQTGSGTSSNMNANEVIATLASRALGNEIHANDDVNMGQSSNDVIPTAIHVSATLLLVGKLLPCLQKLEDAIKARGKEFDGVVKTGRTHLMDAMPLRLSQELGGWASQISHGRARLMDTLPRLSSLAQGGTAVGTGINAHPAFGSKIALLLSERTGHQFKPAMDYFEALSCQDTAVEVSGQLKVLAVALTKIANDLRWMNSGPLSGFAEIELPALQPGSSIMPGKINPVIPEAVAMVAAQVIGNDATITVAGQSGSFQLNVMLPVIAYNLVQSIEILANASGLLADKAITGFAVNRERLAEAVNRNPILATALNPVIGYEAGAAIAKKAYAEGKSIREIAAEITELTEEDLNRLLDVVELTRGGIKS